jgi:iron-sulfur cluster insertion protein
MTNQDIEFIVTDSAIKRIKDLIALENKEIKGLKISVEAGGCSGLKYKYDLTNDISDSDIIVSDGDTKVYIDSVSSQFINNSKLDYVEELGAAYFQISNPNASSKCGCGSSFGI